jgi:hypothetical protein
MGGKTMVASHIILAILIAIPAVYFLYRAVIMIHRLLLHLEKKGYIYYTKNDGSVDRAGIAMLEMQSMLEPSKRHVIELKQKELHELRHPGDPPSPSTSETKESV